MSKASASLQETCFYCGESYPRPISLHHSTEECLENEAGFGVEPEALTFAKSFILAEDENRNDIKDLRVSTVMRAFVKLANQPKNNVARAFEWLRNVAVNPNLIGPNASKLAAIAFEEWLRLSGGSAAKDSARWAALKALAGNYQDGSQTIVKLHQDDALRACFITVGRKTFGTDNSTFDSALDEARKALL